ncbi:MAG: phosphoglycerate kinase [Mollicutes bacterium]|nr:phosphoglycerate kinase [Mollicutes bacterium]
MKKTIKDYDLNGKKVIIRCDFNVPIKNGIISDDNRIVESLPTIKYAIENGAKVILMSHLGRIKTAEDLPENTLLPVAKRLSELLKKEVVFVSKTRGKELEDAINKLNNSDVLLMENTRYEDLNGELESSNDEALGKYWASLGDIFINDAFGTAHRSHASNVGIATYLPSGIGFLIEKELMMLEETINNPVRPFTVILGGAKVSDKIGVIENLVKVADYILIGGGMSYTFLVADGKKVGKSLVDKEMIDFCKNILANYRNKIILPIDVVCGKEISEATEIKECDIDEFSDDNMGLDIGPKTVDLFKEYLEKSKTIIWNGPVGVFEINKFANGTKRVCEILTKLDAIKIAGGGDTGSAIINFGYEKGFNHISTGGGASLTLLEGKVLSGIDVIADK